MTMQQIIDKEPAEFTTEDGIHLTVKWSQPFYPQGSKILMDEVLWREEDFIRPVEHFKTWPMPEEDRVMHATTDSGYVPRNT